MRIAVLTSIGSTLDAFFPPIIDHWRAAGHDVVTASSGPSSTAPHHVLNSLTRRPSVKNILAPREISRWLATVRADVVVTNTAVASFLARAKLQPCPVVYFCHGLHWNRGNSLSERLWQFLEETALKRTDAVVVINSDDEEWFRARLPEDRVLRLNAGVGLTITEYPRTPNVSRDSKLRLVWAGEFSDRKRPNSAIDVMCHLVQLQPSVHLSMCGDGPLMRTVRQRVIQAGLSDNVSLLGHVHKISEPLSNAHALIMTSTWEGLPRVALEATAIGRPTFAFDVKGVRSLPDVVLTNDGDARALAETLSSAADIGFDGFVTTEPQVLDAAHAAEQLAAFLIAQAPSTIE